MPQFNIFIKIFFNCIEIVRNEKDNDKSLAATLSLNIKNMNKLNQIPHTSQEKPQEISKQLILFILQTIKQCPKTFKRVLALLLKMDNIYKVINPSEDWLACQIKCSRVHVSRVVQALVCLGLLTVINTGWVPAKYKKGVCIQDGYWATNIYKFSSQLYDREFRYQLAGVLPGCQALEFTLLMLFEKDVQKQNVTLLRPNRELKSRTLYGDRRTLCKRELRMETNGNEKIRSLESLKNTPMSEADVKAITAYPDEVVQYANRQAIRKGHLANPIGYFLVCCREFNKKRSLLGVNPAARLETQRESLQKGPTKSYSFENNHDYLYETQSKDFNRMLNDPKVVPAVKEALQRMIEGLANKLRCAEQGKL